MLMLLLYLHCMSASEILYQSLHICMMRLELTDRVSVCCSAPCMHAISYSGLSASTLRWPMCIRAYFPHARLLCCAAGEIIAMQGLMNLIFEVSDLAVASPATVSRCGMVYVQSDLLGWRPVMQSWINTLPVGITEAHKVLIRSLFDWLIPPCLRVALKQVRQPAVCGHWGG